MDNITHSMVGLIIGEAAYEIRKYNDKPDSENIRRYFLTVSCIANNFPDLDILYSGMLGQLGYLLHHRGHTHTIIGALLQGGLLFTLVFYFAKFRKQIFDKNDWKWICALSIAGPLMHLWMDGFNSYGIHPYWPFNNRWVYGDSVFIVEPSLWLVLSITLFKLNNNKYAKMVLGAITVTAILLCVVTGFVPHVITLCLIGFAVLYFVGLGYLTDYRKTFTGLFLMSLLVLLFNRSSKSIKREFVKYYKAQYENSEIRDLILSPFPANPFCWNVITVEMSDEKREYFMKRGILASFPKLFALKDCEKLGFVGKNAVFQADEKLSQVHWLGQVRTDLKVLTEYQDNYCLAKEFLQFARAPYFTKEDKKVKMIDLRFVRNDSPSFSEVVLVDNPKCLSVGAPWVPPRNKELEEYLKEVTVP